MRVIGLTGGIGTGKSEVARILEQLGATVINADLLGHRVYEPYTDAWQEVVAAFGPQVLQPDGVVDRKRLAEVVFADPDALARLNAITHPRIYTLIEQMLAQLRRQGVAVAVVEVALLIEAGWTPLVDEVWVVSCPEEQVLQRLRSRNHLSTEAIQRRARSQLSLEERLKHADVVVDNSGTLHELRARVETWWNEQVRERNRIGDG
ncbi:MAG: dephospho-CoA kinase [Dehalococcoidia bacterium]